MAEQKAFKATKRKLEKARKEGNVLKSQLLTPALGLTICSLATVFLLDLVWVKKQKLIKSCFINSSLLPQQCVVEALSITFGVVAAILFVAALCGVTMEVAQLGFRFEFSLLMPKAERLDIGAGIKRIFTGVKNLWKTLVQYSFLILVLAESLWRLHEKLAVQLVKFEAIENMDLLINFIYFVVIAGVAFFFVGVFDYLVRRREYFAQLSMSHDEIFREQKDAEGDPNVKGMRRQIHEELISQNVVEQIKKAKVIVVERS